MKKIVTLAASLWAFSAFCLVGVGSFTESVGVFQHDREGGTEYFAINPSIAVNHMLKVTGNHYFMPELGYVFHTLSTSDEYTKRSLYFLYMAGYDLGSTFFLRYGAGTYVTTIEGDGGTISRENGSTTQTFHLPSGPSNSYNTAAILGVEKLWKSGFSARVDGHVFSLLDSESRTLGFSLSVNWYPK